MGTVLAEMLSGIALTRYLGMKTEFKTKNMKDESSGTFIIKILEFKSDRRIGISKKNTAHNNKELIKLCFSAAVVLVCIIVLCYNKSNYQNNNTNIFASIYLD